MSHFVVVVIGDYVEDQMAPYQENNMGDCPEEYLEFIDCTDDVEKEWKDHPLRLLADAGEQTPIDYQNIEEFAHGWFGYEKNEEGKFGHEANPNAQWDWYEVGGRWTGYFVTKQEERVDQVQLCELDLDCVTVPYAIVKDGKWHAQGKMGWFGSSSNDTEQDEWDKEFRALLSDLHPETLLTVVDCHI